MKPVRSPKRATPKDFDVMEFLRPTDTDIKSALHTLIGPSTDSKEAGPAIEPALNIDPPLKLDAESKSPAGIQISPAPVLRPPLNLSADAPLAPKEEKSVAEVVFQSGPGPELRPATNKLPSPVLRPPPKLIARTDIVIPKKRNFAIREASTATEGHSRAENDVYLALWNEATPQADGSRLITIGMLNLGRLSGLSESNARINLRSLQRKLAVEEHSTFVCENSLGRTWRVFSPEEIMIRRRNAGLIWYMKRTLAVVFVDPETGSQLSRGS